MKNARKMMNRARGVIFFVLILGIVFEGCKSKDEGITDQPTLEPPTEDQPPNVVIFLADDLTFNDLGSYGGVNVPTPNINRLATEGMRFTRAYTSSSQCTPSRTALYTGLYPVRNGAHQNTSDGVIKPGVESIAHHLNRVGYRVGLTGKEHIFPLQQFYFERVPGFTRDIVGQDANYNTNKIKPFMLRNKSQPYCLVVGSTLPHAPWTEGDRGQFNLAELELHPNWVDTDLTRERFRNYLAEVSALDKQVGDVLTILEELGQVQNTLFLFLGEQGAQLAGNKWTLWDQGIRSAMIARLPGVIEAGTVSDQLVQYVDVIPTIFELIEEEIPTDLDGTSFAKILTGESNDEIRDYGYAMHSNATVGQVYSIRAVFNKQYKLIWNLDYQKQYYNKYENPSKYILSWIAKADTNERASFLVDRYIHRPEFELYDLTQDPYELENLADLDGYTDIMANLKEKLDAWMVQQGDPGSSIDQ